MKRLTFIIYILAMLLPGMAFAETPLDMAREARGAYHEKNYQQAIQKWQELLSLGFSNGNIYFNLSHAYWEIGQPGNALRYLLMANRWKPRDADIFNNLSYVQNKMNSAIGPQPRWKVFLQENIVRPLKLNYYESFFLLALISLIFFGLIIRGILKRKPIKKKWSISLGVLWFLVLLLWSQSYFQFFMKPIGVIVIPNAVLLSAPTLEAPTGKSLREGQVVILEKKQGEFQLVKTTNGEGGWIETSQVGKVE